eukprot:6183080-Pleurochrysis_carterae.AAC.2
MHTGQGDRPRSGKAVRATRLDSVPRKHSEQIRGSVSADQDADTHRAVGRAKAEFTATAKKQINYLVAEGVDRGSASNQLMDELLQQRGLVHGGAGGGQGERASTWSVGDVAFVVERTGFSESQARRTLLLREEIKSLRKQGYDTDTSVIGELNRRLYNARIRKERPQENSAPPSMLKMKQAKKSKLGDKFGDELVSPPSRALPEGAGFYRLQPRFSGHGHEKRPREDPHPPQHKKLKLRSTSTQNDGGFTRILYMRSAQRFYWTNLPDLSSPHRRPCAIEAKISSDRRKSLNCGYTDDSAMPFRRGVRKAPDWSWELNL